MGLKQFVDDHPLKVVVSIAVAVATTTAGATGYLITKKNEIESSRSQLEAKTEIASLKTRLASIERRVGTDEQSFFDISKLIVPPEGVKSLDATYKTMAEGAFFISEPVMKDWSFRQTSELEMLKEGFSLDDNDPMIKKLAGAIDKKNVYLWRGGEIYTIRSAAKDANQKESLTLYPFVAVQIISDKDFQGVVKAMGKFISKPKEIDSIVSEIGKNSSGKIDKVSEDVLANTLAAVNTEKTERVLSKLFRGDLAALLLQGLLGGSMQTTKLFSDTQFILKTAQKKGNVFFMETRIEFNNVTVNGKAEAGRVILDQEYFVVTGPSGATLVKIQIPSHDGRAEAYSWVAQWLTGLRMPILR